jgi:hypothetical protein
MFPRSNLRGGLWREPGSTLEARLNCNCRPKSTQGLRSQMTNAQEVSGIKSGQLSFWRETVHDKRIRGNSG